MSAERTRNTSCESADKLNSDNNSPTIRLPLAVPDIVLAVDLDDVLCETNITIAAWHNEQYGTNMDVSTFYCKINCLSQDDYREPLLADYYYWKNPGWGTPSETFQKVSAFYSIGRIGSASPVPGAREGIYALREMGYRLVIVSARLKNMETETCQWVEQHFPNAFEAVICIGQFKDQTNPSSSSGPVVKTAPKSKRQVCSELGAQLLIDDSAENALLCAVHEDPLRVLLFGEYQWNRRVCSPEDFHDDTAFDRRLQLEGGREFWRDEELVIPHGAPLWRVKDWSEVLLWILREREEGRI